MNFLIPFILSISNQHSDVRIFAVGITQEIDEPFLAAISGDVGVIEGQQTPGHDYLILSDFLDLDNVVANVSTGVCTSAKPS